MRLLGIAAFPEARSRGTDGSRPRRAVPPRRGDNPGAACPRNRTTRRPRPEPAPVLRPLRPAPGANHADPGSLCGSARGRDAQPEQLSELDAVHFAIQSDEEPVLLDPMRLWRWAADRPDGHGTALRRSGSVAGLPRLRRSRRRSVEHTSETPVTERS